MLLKKIGKTVVSKKNAIMNKRFHKYIIDFKVEGDRIQVISNTGKCRIVKNTKNNITKINNAIIKNKIEIAKKIDLYEMNSRERILVLVLNCLLLCGMGGLIPLTFFMGSYLLFMFSIVLFSLGVLTTTMIGFSYYISLKEIQSLKKITGYKKDTEFQFSNPFEKFLKSHN